MAFPSYLRVRRAPQVAADQTALEILGARPPNGSDIPKRSRKPGGRSVLEPRLAVRLWQSHTEALIDLALAHADSPGWACTR